MNNLRTTINGKTKPFKFPTKEDLEEYKTICLKLWGGIPLDVDWATGTTSYKEEKNNLKKD